MAKNQKMKLPWAYARGIFVPRFVGSEIPPKRKYLHFHPRAYARGFSRRGITFFVPLLIILCSLFFIPFLIKPELLTIKDNDLGRNYIPIFNFIRTSFYENKQIPLWRPDQMMGEPFLANPISTLFYPLMAIFLVLPVNLAAIIFYITHFIVAAISTYFLARSFSLSKSSAFASAIFYTFSTKMLLHVSAGHITMVSAFAYLPLAFLVIRKILTEDRGFRWIIPGALSLTFILALYPTVFYYTVIFLASYVFYFIVIRQKIKKIVTCFIKKAVPLTLVLVLSVMLSAIFLLPQLEFGPLSTRSQLSILNVGLPLWNLRMFLQSLIFPYLNFKSFDQESFLYLGIVPIVLSIFAICHLGGKQKIVVIIFGILTVLFIAGLSTPVFPLAYKYLPLLKYSRITTRMWFVIALIVSLIAASVLQKIKNKKIVYLLIACFIIETFYIGYRKTFSISDLSFSNQSLYQFLASDRELFRVYCATYCFNPQLISKYKIQLLNGETPIQLTNVTDFLQRAGNYNFSDFAVIFPPYQIWQTEKPPVPNAEILGLANVKYIASTYEIQGDNFNLIRKFDDIYLFSNKKFKPRAYFESSQDLEVVKFENYSSNDIIVNFDPAPHARKLIFSEIFYPGWHAYVGSKEIKVEEKEPLFRMAQIDPYSNRLQLKYEPKVFVLGKAITLLTLLFFAFLLLV